MNKEEKLTGQATDEQIKALKKKHGDIFFTKAEGHIAYFRKPTRQELGYAMSAQSDPLKMSELILKSCFIDGSDIFTTDTGFMLGTAELREQLSDVKSVELGKL
jgi:hypothetical protein